MKSNKFFLIIGLLVCSSTFTLFGQIRLNVNVNLQPAWGPSSCNYAEYYFLPELGLYYSVNDQLFIYPSGNRWVRSVDLPRAYRHYNLYNTYKVVINEPDPYRRNSFYVNKYSNWQGKHQETRRDMRHTDRGRHLGEYKRQSKHFNEKVYVYDMEEKHHGRR